ncbi:MAG: ABC transporter permease [Candidatus Helarchaeota archaeon]
MKGFFQQIVAITEKEIRLELRFGKDFFLKLIVTPLLFLIPYFLLYMGIFNYVTEDLGTLTPENYPVWLFLGSIFFTFGLNGFNSFDTKFMYEKYWMTIQALMLTPISRYAILIGGTIETFIRSFITFLIFVIFSYIFLPTGIINIFAIILILNIILAASMGIGILRGGIALVNENYRSFLSYFVFFVLFFSCYSIPFSLLPGPLKNLALANPFYHGLLLIRSIWFNTLEFSMIYSFIYLLVFAALCIVLGIWLFNKLLKRFGIQGY